MAEQLCRIKLAVSVVEACPQGACPFWEHGGAVVDSGCGLERIPLELDHPDIAEYLLGLRETLEKARNDAERNAARRSFAELAPPELTGR